MADLTVPQHDTWPPVRGVASDEDGVLDLTAADELIFIMKQGATVVSGTATALDPDTNDGFNWQYVWADGDTALTGTYAAELEVTWDSGSTPPQVETVPNEGTLEVVIRSDLGGNA